VDHQLAELRLKPAGWDFEPAPFGRKVLLRNKLVKEDHFLIGWLLLLNLRLICCGLALLSLLLLLGFCARSGRLLGLSLLLAFLDLLFLLFLRLVFVLAIFVC